MILEHIARLIHEAAGFNTLNVRTMEVFFQKSPGVSEGDNRGIPGLEYRVMSDGRQTQSGTTGDDGLVAVQCRPNTETVLELMVAGSPVAQYKLTFRDTPFEPDSSFIGIQRRLRTLGYQLGAAGDTHDGVDNAMGRRTDKAIQDFQIDAGLAFDSIAGDGTRSELSDAVGGSAEA
jgi:peptidoglycan hydrolase-like protein with peptidoglycan-binding domain